MSCEGLKDIFFIIHFSLANFNVIQLKYVLVYSNEYDFQGFIIAQRTIILNEMMFWGIWITVSWFKLGSLLNKNTKFSSPSSLLQSAA